jgi:AcrR family transcriptional regulator
LLHHFIVYDEVDMTRPESTTIESRGARRRERTREALLEGARVVFARKGPDASTIAEITEQADVGFGSFYNHFASKEEIAEAVLTLSIEQQGRALARLTGGLEDPAEVVSVAHRYFVVRAAADPDWARVLIRLDVSHRVAVAALGPHARRDLARGIEQGRFCVADEEVTMWSTGGALLGVMRAVLDGTLAPGADVHHAENVLRMLGIPLEEAAQIARRRLPPLGPLQAGPRRR